jgi:hypothetical protein
MVPLLRLRQFLLLGVGIEIVTVPLTVGGDGWYRWGYLFVRLCQLMAQGVRARARLHDFNARDSI